MRIPRARITGTGLLLAWVAALFHGPLGGCRTEEPPEGSTDQQRAASALPGAEDAPEGRVVTLAPRTDQTPALAPRRAWRRLAPPEAGFLVSPRVSPSGRYVAVRGRGGRGLFLLDLHPERQAAGPAGPGAFTPSDGLEVLDAGHRGPAGWARTPGGEEEVLIWKGPGGVRAYRTGRGVAVSWVQLSTTVRREGLPWERPWDDVLGRRLQKTVQGAWWHHGRLGTVTWVDREDGPGGAASTAVADHGAWGAVVSPDGRRVAWSTGDLAKPTLHVHDRATGETVSPGPGAHPAWLPDESGSPGSRLLVYTEVQRVARVGGRGEVTDSDLHLLDVRTGHDRVLARTPGVAEMEPRPAPGGSALVFVDWRDGAVYLASLERGGGR